MPVHSCTSENLLPVIKGRSLFTASSAPCKTRSWHWSETVTIDLHSVRREPDTIYRTPIDSIRRTIRQTVVLTYDIRTIEVYFSWTECERLRQRQRVCPAIWHTDHSFRFLWAAQRSSPYFSATEQSGISPFFPGEISVHSCLKISQCWRGNEER